MKKLLAFLLCCCLVTACSDDKRYAPKEGRLTVFENAPLEQTQGTPELFNIQNTTEWLSKNFNNTNVLPNTKVTETTKPTWKERIGKNTDLKDRILPPPVIQNDALYVLDGTYTLTKANLTDGKQQWQKNLAQQTAGVALTLKNDILFAASTNGHITAVKTDGTQLWQKDLEVALRSQILADKKALYFVTTHNQLIVLNQKDGTELWRYQTTKPQTLLQEMASPALSKGVLVVPFSTGEVIAFDVDSGLMLWIQMMIGNRPQDLTEVPQIAAAPVIDEDLVYLSGNANLTGAYGLKTGSSKWTNNLASQKTPILGKNALFMLTTQNMLVALNKQNGKIFWQQKYVPESDETWHSLTVRDDNLILDDGVQTVFINPKDGKQTKVIKSNTHTQPIVIDGHVVTMDKKTNVSLY